MDAFGRRVWRQDLDQQNAPVQINIPEAATWTAGVYYWELRHGNDREQGTFIRQ